MTGKRAPQPPASARPNDPHEATSTPADGGKRSVTVEVVIASGLARQPTPCVLVIASYRGYADGLRALLRVDSRQIEMAHDGVDGLRVAGLIKPDIVLCDLELRGIPSAFGIARALRSDPSLEHVYLVGLTGNDPASCEEYALRSGFDEIVRKSGDISPIEAIIANRAAGTL